MLYFRKILLNKSSAQDWRSHHKTYLESFFTGRKHQILVSLDDGQCWQAMERAEKLKNKTKKDVKYRV